MADEPCRVVCGGSTWQISRRRLGKGGFASVFEASSQHGMRAAVKVVDLRQQSAWVKAKLRSEAENLERAQTHANIVRFYGAVRCGSHHVFVLEAWGRDLLEQVLETRGIGEKRSLHVMTQVLCALDWLHSKNICHG